MNRRINALIAELKKVPPELRDNDTIYRLSLAQLYRDFPEFVGEELARLDYNKRRAERRETEAVTAAKLERWKRTPWVSPLCPACKIPGVVRDAVVSCPSCGRYRTSRLPWSAVDAFNEA